MAAYDLEQFLRFYVHANYPKDFPSGADMQFHYIPQTAQWEVYCSTTHTRMRVTDTDIKRAGFDPRGFKQADTVYTPDYNFALDQRGYDPVGELRAQQRINKELHDKLDRAEQELSDLRRRFETLFRVPAVGMRTEMDQPPENPEQWRVRIHVPAFTVETTMGALTAAKGAPGAAMTWGHVLTLQRDVYSRALEEALTHISTHIITGNHPIESAEPETPQEPI